MSNGDTQRNRQRVTGDTCDTCFYKLSLARPGNFYFLLKKMTIFNRNNLQKQVSQVSPVTKSIGNVRLLLIKHNYASINEFYAANSFILSKKAVTLQLNLTSNIKSNFINLILTF